jgi:hypothetical protein
LFQGFGERLTSSTAEIQWLWILGGIALFVLAAGMLTSGREETESHPKKAAQADKQPQKTPAPEKAEKAAQEAPAKPPKPKPLPPPHDPRERILYFLKKRNYEAKSTQVVVKAMPNGCKSATVNYKTPFVGSTLPSEAANYYRVIYGDIELRHELCFLRTNAYRSAHDKYGNPQRVRMLTTSMGRQRVEKINWEHKGSVNFQGLYNLEYMAPSARADIARENARHAVDCAQDSGMFDFDFDC